MENFLIELPIPSMGATVAELTVIDILISAGDEIKKDQKIAEMESDKSAFEFESPCDGRVEKLMVRAGDILPVGTAFVRLYTSDETLRHLQVKESSSPQKLPQNPATAKTTPVISPAVSQVSQSQKPNSTVPAAALTASTSSLLLTPRAQKILSDAGVSSDVAANIVGTAPGGKISGEDVLKYLDEKGLKKDAAEKSSVTTTSNHKDMQTVCVAGIGYAVPDHVVSNKEILKAFPTMTEEEVVKLTGISERRTAGPDETATSLAAKAVRQALAQANIDVSEIDGIIMATLIPDQPVPSMASALAKLLGIKTALAFDMNAACSGWLYALEVGRAFICAGTAKKLIVVTAELLSRITNPKDHATAFLFGDGAGAVILTDADGGHRLNRLKLSGDAENFDAISRTGGGASRPMPLPDGRDRDDFYIKMDGAVVFKSAVRAFADLIEDALARHQIKPEEVAWVVPHQANERILRAVSKRVGIPYERFVVTIAKYGNTSAASVSMALGWAAHEGIFKDGDKIIFCSVGAGFTFAGGLLVW
jgi:3-oxoacyl-(acyl-carrier-protein) synthase III